MLERVLGDRRPQRARQVRPTLGPVEARPCKRPAGRAHRLDIQTELCQLPLTNRRKPVLPIARLQHSLPLEAVGDRDANLSRQMVVISARVMQRLASR